MSLEAAGSHDLSLQKKTVVGEQRGQHAMGNRDQRPTARVQPWWIQGDSKVGGRSWYLWKNTYLIIDIERLEMDTVVGRLVEKKRLNNLDYVE